MVGPSGVSGSSYLVTTESPVGPIPAPGFSRVAQDREKTPQTPTLRCNNKKGQADVEQPRE